MPVLTPFSTEPLHCWQLTKMDFKLFSEAAFAPMYSYSVALVTRPLVFVYPKYVDNNVDSGKSTPICVCDIVLASGQNMISSGSL